MDTLPPPEFFDIFHRVSILIDLKGCESPEDIERRMRRCLRLMQNAVDGAKKESTKRKWLGWMKILWTIIRDGSKPTTALTTGRKYELGVPNRRVGFPRAVIEEAVKHPNGIVNLTLEHGYKKAKKKSLKEKRKRLGVMTIHKRGLYHSRNRV